MPTADSADVAAAPARSGAGVSTTTANVGGAALSVTNLFSSITARHWLMYGLAAMAWLGLLFLLTWDAGVGWLSGWHQWDANWYEQIARDGWGYDPHTLAFMPAFAWLAGGFARLFQIDFDLASMLMNVSCFFLAGVISSEYLARRAGVSKWWLYGFHLSSPVAFYALMPYSDALFYLLFWVALISAEQFPREKRSRAEFAAECLFMFMMPFVRLTSFALAVWILFRRWFAAAVFLTLAVIVFVNWKLTSEPLYFLRVQEEFAMPHGWFIHGIWQAAGRDLVSEQTMANPAYWFQVSVLPLASTVLILIAALWMNRRREYFWLATMIAVAFMSRNQAFWRSVLRYDLPLMPLMAVPWLAWAQPRASRAGLLRKWLGPFVAAVMIGALLGCGLYFQLSVGHRLHRGGWGY